MLFQRNIVKSGFKFFLMFMELIMLLWDTLMFMVQGKGLMKLSQFFWEGFWKMKKSKSPSAKSNKSVKKRTYKKGSLKEVIYKLFDRKGVAKVSYKEVEKLAKKVKPDTKFNKYHFSWYRNNYKKTKAK